MQRTTRWVLALAAFVALLAVPRASDAQQMNFSYLTDYYYSADGSTLYTYVDGSDNSTGCQHGNFSSTGYLYGPTGNATQTAPGLTVTVGLPIGDGGNFAFSSDLVLDCSCFGSGLDGGGASNTVTVLPVPSGETSLINAWADYSPVALKFRAQLNGTASFTGRQVQEQPGGGDIDNCWFSQSIYAYWRGLSGGSWPVDGASQYGDDILGWDPNKIIYYRNNGRAPCQAETNQIMQINQTSPKWVNYKTNRLKNGFTMTSVWNERDGVHDSKNWP